MSPHRRNSHDSSNNNHENNNQDPNLTFDRENGPWPCSLPKGCLFSNGSNLEHIRISAEDLSEAVKVKCSNEQCPHSPYMHTVCFETFEESALQHLRASGRSKSWTEKQRHQNLWTKRGYDLVYKACDCICGHGHVRKDLDWTQPAPANPEGDHEGDGAGVAAGGTRRKRKKSKSHNMKPTLTIGLPVLGANSQVIKVELDQALMR